MVGEKAKCCMCLEHRVLGDFLRGELENIDWDCSQQEKGKRIDIYVHLLYTRLCKVISTEQV